MLDFKLRHVCLTETDDKPQALREDVHFKNIIQISGKLQQLPHPCPCLLKLPPPKQPHPEMATGLGSALPQHNLYFEEADCKLYSYICFVSLFFFLS